MSGETTTWRKVERAISRATGAKFRASTAAPVSGGDINRSYRLEGDNEAYFVKLNTAAMLPMFEAEQLGLEEILATGTVNAPRPLCAGRDENYSWLVLEALSLTDGDAACAERLGQQLAQMHRHSTDTYGWQRDNTIGTTAQINNPTADWAGFWATHRLGFQLQLAEKNGAPGGLIDAGARLTERVGAFFSDYQPPPSLLHGDLWGGNWSGLASGEPVIYDPAVYFGDREADLAMTELFGGFPDRFYQSYVSVWAIDPGYSVRKVLYNLYHVLNHLNLFGGGYATQAQDMIERLLAELS